MKYYAHSTNYSDKRDWQTLKEHLTETAELVAQYSESFCEMEYAMNLGLLHDIGKYQIAFQKRLEGDRIAVEHSIYGAMEWIEHNFPESGAYCIAGHHGGLLDIGTNSDTKEDSTLKGRLKRGTSAVVDYSAYQQEIQLYPVKGIPAKNISLPTQNITKEELEMLQKELAFWTRMMFSCLVDADFLNTETFYNKTPLSYNQIDFSDLLSKLQLRMNQFSIDTPINKLRNHFRKQILKHIKKEQEIYFLNLPTGAGKTLLSMEFALYRAIYGNKKKIIYVIPFTSIIEQNAKVFKDIFGEEMILEHHSNFDINEMDSVTTQIKEKLMKSVENWSADIIVTTNVQFFESIYSNKNSKVRKLHNLVDSVIVFDEIHMLPTRFFQPSLEAIKILTQRYGCEAIFMSATMPDFNRWLTEFQCGNMNTLDLIPDKSRFQELKRCRIENLGEKSLDFIVEKIQENRNALMVVNKKMTARTVYEELKKANQKVYHLSTYMTHYDRERTIYEVREALAKDESFYLVSTSLIEAGVDLDFDVVFRELAGLENLLQTAGRCNREGNKENSVAYSFSFEEERFAIRFKNDMETKQKFTKVVFEKFEDISSEEAIAYYFDTLYEYWKNDMNAMNFSKAITTNCCNKENMGFDFKSYGEEFRFIDDNTISVIILPEDNEEAQQLRDTIFSIPYMNQAIKRKLQKYTVSLIGYEFKELYEQGVLIEENSLCFLGNENYYDAEIGILLEDNIDCYYI